MLHKAMRTCLSPKTASSITSLHFSAVPSGLEAPAREIPIAIDLKTFKKSHSCFSPGTFDLAKTKFKEMAVVVYCTDRLGESFSRLLESGKLEKASEMFEELQRSYNRMKEASVV